MFKKISFKLLTSKKKRDLQYAFLAIKNCSILRELSIMNNHFNKNINCKILVSIFQKLLKNRLF